MGDGRTNSLKGSLQEAGRRHTAHETASYILADWTETCLSPHQSLF